MSDVPDPLLGRPTLEALGTNTKDLFAGATDKTGNSIGVSSIISVQNSPEGSIASIINGGLYHGDKSVSDDTADGEGDSWFDLGQDINQ